MKSVRNRSIIGVVSDPTRYKVFILAAGLGTRLRPLTESVPKVMMPIEGDRPILEHTIQLLKDQGFRRFVVNTHYLGEKIISYFKDGRGLGVEISYSHEPEVALDTAGALKHASHLLSDDFLLLYGDELHFFDFAPALEFHEREKPIATVILKRSAYPQEGDVVEIDRTTSRVIGWRGRPHDVHAYGEKMFLNSGLYVLSKNILDYIPKGLPVKLDGEIFPKLIKDNARIYGYVTDDDILDIGTPENYERAKRWYREKKASRAKKHR